MNFINLLVTKEIFRDDSKCSLKKGITLNFRYVSIVGKQIQ